jgi:hypothetical protein
MWFLSGSPTTLPRGNVSLQWRRFVAPAVPFAEGRPLPDWADAPSQPRCSLQFLSPQAIEAIFAGGWLYGAQWLPATTHNQSEKIILWDEGPANAARSVSVGVDANAAMGSPR